MPRVPALFESVMRRSLGALASLLLAVGCVNAQVPQVNDPANLTGEHVAPRSPADTLPINHGAPALQQLLLKLRTRASLMMIVAHPDDEDGGMLTYESRGQGARVAMLTLNRGEGGQNLMSADFDDALGLIRTQELLAADRYMGVDQMFGTEVDFGFSKTKEESFEKWTHDRVLYDAVRAVRLYRPLVLASVFVGAATDGHGHHQVAGEITQEVFKAAADPNVFPELIGQGLLPWAPLKVYARVPFSRVTAAGMYDYATGKTIPPRFENYVTGAVSTQEPRATVTIHEGEPATTFGKPMLGMDGLSYVQFARRGLALQKTQIGQNVRLAPAGAYDVGYTRYGSRLAKQSAQEKDLFDGIDTSLPGMISLAPGIAEDGRITLSTNLLDMQGHIEDAQNRFDPAHLDSMAEPLRAALKTCDGLIARVQGAQDWRLTDEGRVNLLHELRVKRVQLNDAVILSLGITLTSVPEARPNTVNVSTTTPSTLVGPLALLPGGLVHIHGSLNRPLDDLHAEVDTGSSRVRLTPAAGTLALDATFVISPSLPPTRPYFSRPNVEQPFYNISDPNLRNAPAAPTPFAMVLHFTSAGVPLELESTPADPVAPELLPLRVAQAPDIVAALDIGVPPLRVIASHPGDPAPIPPLQVGISAKGGAVTGTLSAQLPAGWTTTSVKLQGGVIGGAPGGYVPGMVPPPPPTPAASPETSPVPPKTSFTLTGAGQSNAYAFQIAPEALTPNTIYPISLSATTATHSYEGRYARAGYPGLTHTQYYLPATTKAVAVDVTTAPNLRVAYLPGTGDAVAGDFSSLGIHPTILSPASLSLANLRNYDAVVLGVRTYAAHPELAGAGSEALLDYARQGGAVIVQYNTGGYGADSAPYPISVPGDSAHNVVVEADPVTILDPTAPLLNWPNRITAADFDGWVEERGHGFASTWDPRFRPLLETHDPDQDPQRGGLLFARVGQGAYVYLALALYRQLPEGVPGAYRLLANLISLRCNPELFPGNESPGQPKGAPAIQPH